MAKKPLKGPTPDELRSAFKAGDYAADHAVWTDEKNLKATFDTPLQVKEWLQKSTHDEKYKDWVEGNVDQWYRDKKQVHTRDFQTDDAFIVVTNPKTTPAPAGNPNNLDYDALDSWVKMQNEDLFPVKLSKKQAEELRLEKAVHRLETHLEPAPKPYVLANAAEANTWIAAQTTAGNNDARKEAWAEFALYPGIIRDFYRDSPNNNLTVDMNGRLDVTKLMKWTNDQNQGAFNKDHSTFNMVHDSIARLDQEGFIIDRFKVEITPATAKERAEAEALIREVKQELNKPAAPAPKMPSKTATTEPATKPVAPSSTAPAPDTSTPKTDAAPKDEGLGGFFEKNKYGLGIGLLLAILGAGMGEMGLIGSLLLGVIGFALAGMADQKGFMQGLLHSTPTTTVTSPAAGAKPAVNGPTSQENKPGLNQAKPMPPQSTFTEHGSQVPTAGSTEPPKPVVQPAASPPAPPKPSISNMSIEEVKTFAVGTHHDLNPNFNTLSMAFNAHVIPPTVGIGAISGIKTGLNLKGRSIEEVTGIPTTGKSIQSDGGQNLS